MIDYVYIYSTSDKHKIIGKLENVSKYESLKGIRLKIKLMSKSDEFVKPMNGIFDILDKDTEEDFCLKDILINENAIYKIYIKKSNNEKIIRYEYKNIPKYGNIINQKNSIIPLSQNINIKNKNNMNNINVLNEINDINNMNNNIFNMNNMNNIKLNNFLQINNMNNMHNMNNFNKINNINIIDNNINNLNNINNINNMNNLNIMNNNNNLMNQNNPNKISIKFNDQMNDDFAKKYHIHFKTNNIDYIILANGRTKIFVDDIFKNKKGLIDKFQEKMEEDYLFPIHVLFLYNGINIKNKEIGTKTVSDIFKNNRNPTIFVKDYNMISKLILVTFKINNGDKYEIIFNSKSNIFKLIKDFLKEIGFYIFDYLNFDFLYKGHIINFQFNYNDINKKNYTTLEKFFKNDNNPIIIVNDKNNIVGQKIKINFETNFGYKHEIVIQNKKTVFELLSAYIGEIDDHFYYSKLNANNSDNNSNLIYNFNQIIFIYKEQQILYNSMITIVDYFKNDYNPTIFVKDLHNLFFINWDAYRCIIFQTNHGNRNKLVFKNSKTVNEMLSHYYILIGYEKLFQKDTIQFFYNNKKLNNPFPFNFFGTEFCMTVGQLFQSESNPTVFVNDIYNLLLINWKQTKNVTFNINQKYRKEIVVDNLSDFDSIIKKFLNEINQRELENNDKIKYLYNSKEINFKNMITAGELFLNDYNPVIFVKDINNLIILPIDVSFKTTSGYVKKITIQIERTLNYLLLKYLDEIYHSELIDRNDKITFLYNSQKIKFGDKTLLKNLFLNDKNPTIVVIDANNSLLNNTIQKLNVRFQTDKQHYNIIVNYGTTIEQLIKLFLYKNINYESIGNSYYNMNPTNIKFLHSSNSIKFGDKSFVEKLLKNNDVIYVS